MQKLTQKQKQVLNFIYEYSEHFGYPPSIRELARKMKVKWTRGIEVHLQALERKGYLKRGMGISRGIKLTDFSFGRGIPIVGRIAAGMPVLAEENIEGSLMLDPMLAKGGRTFLLRVSGMSMKNAGILDGDLVLVKQQPTAEDGDIVAALVNDEATVKRFKTDEDRVLLIPENEAFPVITVTEEDRFMILGKVVAALRIMEGKIFNRMIPVERGL